MIWTHHPLIWMIICSAMMYIGCFYIPEYIAVRMDETRSGVFKLGQSSLEVQVDPCEKCFGVVHGKTSSDYQPMM